MASKSVTLTDLETGKVILVSAHNIIYLSASGGNSIVTFLSNTNEVLTIKANESVSTVNTAAARTQALTLSTGGTLYLNSDRIIYIDAKGSGSSIVYNAEAQAPVVINVDESPSTVNTAAGNTFAVLVNDEVGGATITRYINNLQVSSIEESSSVVLPTLNATYRIKLGTYNTSAVGSGYTAATVSFSGGGTGAVLPTATANLVADEVVSITITSTGSNITDDVLVTISGDGSAAAAVNVIKHELDTLTLATVGSGLGSQPTVTFGSGTVVATATIGIDPTAGIADSVNITNEGEYLASAFPPSITIAGGAGCKVLYNDFLLTPVKQLSVAQAATTVQTNINAL